MPTRVLALCALLLTMGGVYLAAFAAQTDAGQRRASALSALQKGNWKDAYEGGFGILATDPDDDAMLVSDDLTNGIQCLQNLGRSDEVDEFREKTIATHATNWRLLATAAKTYVNGESYGFIVAGKFYRGGRRGGDGKQVTALERDRIRAMQSWSRPCRSRPMIRTKMRSEFSISILPTSFCSIAAGATEPGRFSISLI